MYVGNKLLPDYFLDEAEVFQSEWMQTKSDDSASKGSSDTPEAVFKVVQSLLTPDVVQKVNSTFLFVVDGKYPGKCVL